MLKKSSDIRGDRARRLIAGSCLIASDVDKTILTQDAHERREFLTSVAPALARIASRGAQFAFLTGNSMSELTTRFLDLFVGYLCEADSLHLLEQFHFFCNAGGVYVHFPSTDQPLREAVNGSRNRTTLKPRVLAALTESSRIGRRAIAARFVDAGYLSRTAISDNDSRVLTQILEKMGVAYLDNLTKHTNAFARMYDLDYVTANHKLIQPYIENRKVRFLSSNVTTYASVQITMKPILSYHQGLDETRKLHLAQRDARRVLIEEIQRELDQAGHGKYEARAGGRASIDITLRKLDKAYALEFLIDKLNLQGNSAYGRQFASNAIYLGDEVLVGGGNDYPVTRLPGLLVFAVNPQKELVPFQTGVYVPSSMFWGPEATSDVLARLDNSIRDVVERQVSARTPGGSAVPEGAIEEFKRKLFAERIATKIDHLSRRRDISADDWQTLNAFVTLLGRGDASGRAWLSILGRELDAVMARIQTHPSSRLPAIGTSHPDGSQFSRAQTRGKTKG
jgi:hydroxymethylpyrimidine pyrophosphatase-like HAD family hydrolase